MKRTSFKDILLIHFTNHRCVMLKSVYEAWSDRKRSEIDKAVEELQEDGWIELRKNYTVKGDVIHQPCVFRTEKNLYSQPELF